MKLGALGDVHGDFAAVQTIVARHPEIPAWVAVGDLGDSDGRYWAPPAPLYWIRGNNDNLEYIAELMAGRASLPQSHFVPNAVPLRVSGVRVVGLGGTFAPTWYDTLPQDLPRPRVAAFPEHDFPPLARDDKRRHFVRAEVEACKRLTGIDLFLTHESARPFMLDVGKTPINEVLAIMRPKLHLSGHHHVFHDEVRQGVRSIGLDPVGVSYLVIDLETWQYARVET
jgi:hypothetical protein